MYISGWKACLLSGRIEGNDMDFAELNKRIVQPDPEITAKSRARWLSRAIPIGSLGLLEEAVIRIAGIIGTPDVRIDKRAVIVMCADNGVVSEGVTQCGSEITALVAGNIARGNSSVCRMARIAHAAVFPIDIGMINPVGATGILDRRIAAGTCNIAAGPAMTRVQAEQAIEVGIDLVRQLKEQGYTMLATGEMGIGNTTTSSAVASVLLGRPAEEVTGRGAGLSDAALKRKIEVIKQAINCNNPDPADALDVLHKLGGFDIAGMAGIFIGGAIYRIPVLVDGFISAVSALTARNLCPACAPYMMASHVSAEPAGRMALDALSLTPIITAGMRLGEGTGAVCAWPLLDMALAVYNDMSTFSDIGMAAYTMQEGGTCGLS